MYVYIYICILFHILFHHCLSKDIDYSPLCYTVGEGNGTPLQYSCLENPMDGGAWSAAVHGVTKSRTRLSDFTFIFHFPALEKDMTTHSSVLSWRIPGTGSLVAAVYGVHRAGHDWSDLAVAVLYSRILLFIHPIYEFCIL